MGRKAGKFYVALTIKLKGKTSREFLAYRGACASPCGKAVP